MRELKCFILTRQPETWSALTQHLQEIPSLRLLHQDTDIREVIRHASLGEADIIFCDPVFAEQLAIHGFLHATAKMPALISLGDQQETAETTTKVAAVLHLPLTREALLEAVKKAISEKHPVSKPLNRKRDTFIFINSEYKIIKIRFEDILFCEGMKDYTQIYLNGKPQPLITLQNLKTFSSKLPEEHFVRVHRSYVVALNHIDTISRNEIAIGKKVIPVGHSYREEFFNIIDFHS